MTHRLGYWFVHVYVVGFSLVLLGGFGMQFGKSEMPCPLCILQRMAMMLCALGGAYIIRKATKGPVSASDLATGYGLSIVAAIAGMVMSGRQVLLHILPDAAGYGDPFLGLHLYTWAFITFTIAILAAAVNLIFAADVTPEAPASSSTEWVSKAVLGLLGAVIAANALVVFAEEGFHWVLPDDPARYELFYDLNLKD
ncbi:MAG TPA: disulfide bond formation protein B [Acidimicrobiales bacterium]